MARHARKRPSGDDYPESGSNIDELFASEPEVRPEPPALIFTLPVDRNVQQFPDEKVLFAEERFDLPLQAAPPIGNPDVPQWASEQPARSGRLQLLVGYALAIAATSLLVATLMPRIRMGGEAPAAPVGATPPFSRQSPVVSDAATGAAAPPVSAEPAQRRVPASVAPPTERTRSSSVMAAPARPVNDKRALVIPPARPALPLPASQVAISAPPAPVARTPAPALAVTLPPASIPDPPRLEVDTAAVLGQPATPPSVEAPLAPRDRPVVPREDAVAARPSATGTAGSVGAEALAQERVMVRSVLSGYEQAYSQLDAGAAARLYPRVDSKALARAFSNLSAQQIRLDSCDIQVVQSTARATCAGTASWTPKVGSGSQAQPRRWQFDLRQVSGAWQIGSVRIQ